MTVTGSKCRVTACCLSFSEFQYFGLTAVLSVLRTYLSGNKTFMYEQYYLEMNIYSFMVTAVAQRALAPGILFFVAGLIPAVRFRHYTSTYKIVTEPKN
jgi:hypothetical protein